MGVLGLPLVLPIAFLSFILGFIPYIGGAIGTMLAFLVAVKVGTTQDIVIMAIWTVVFNIVQGSFIAPIIYGKAVSLHPASCSSASRPAASWRASWACSSPCPSWASWPRSGGASSRS